MPSSLGKCCEQLEDLAGRVANVDSWSWLWSRPIK